MSYDSNNIKVLEGLDAVRKRPGMYIGDTGKEGLHHLIWEIVDNSIDEVMAGYGDTIEIKINKDNSICINDYGRGIPIDIHKEEGISTATLVLTKLHAGGKFDNNAYKTSGGLHGVGASVVNALSSRLILTIRRDGAVWFQEFEKGIPLAKIKQVGKCSKKNTGTSITFYPDPSIFKETTEWDEEIIKSRAKIIAYLNQGLKINFTNLINNAESSFLSEKGLEDYVNELVSKNNELIPSVHFQKKEENIEIDMAFKYEKGFNRQILSYVNNITTPEGGTHEIGATTALTRAFTELLKREKNKLSSKITADDIKEGLSLVIAIKISEPEFRGQTKGKLNNPEARTVTYKVIKGKMDKWIEENPKYCKVLIKKFESAYKARNAAKKSREIVRKKTSSGNALPSKLADCSSKNIQERELYIVEGDSAGGSSKQGRDRHFQAILPLKGKILNTEKATIPKILANAEIQALISAIGCGFGKHYDYSKLRYNKIIIMSDADVDGGHIQFLNLLFLHKFYPELIEKGHVYVAVPPLYSAKKKDKVVYISDDKEIQKKFGTEKKRIGWTFGRFKGLGEMDPQELWETTMNPETRTLIQIHYNQDYSVSADEIFSLLGGDNVSFKKWLIETYTDTVLDKI